MSQQGALLSLRYLEMLNQQPWNEHFRQKATASAFNDRMGFLVHDTCEFHVVLFAL